MLIVGCCLMIFISSYFILSPPNTTQPLEVLALNQDTDPVFYLTSQLTYSHEAAQNWKTELPNEAELNLQMILTDVNPNYTQISEDMVILSEHFPAMSLSILPSDSMTDKAYLSHYEALYSALQEKQLSSILMIAYPATTKELSLYDRPSITCIGTVLRNQSDLERLDQIYTYFSSKKYLVVRDVIQNFYAEDSQIAAQEITASYYKLAIQYPAVQMIFSPHPLKSDALNFQLFNTIYSRLLSQPWLTTSTKAVSNRSPYIPLTSYDTLTDTPELILSPDATVLQQLEKLPKDGYALYFKWNANLLSLNLSYPYTISIDTPNEPNGISRLSVILQDKADQTHQIYAIDLTIHHDAKKQRAPRVPNDTQINTTSIAPRKTYIPILMYHTIEDTVLPENQNSHVETTVFESQMKALLENGYTPINFYDLKNYADGLVSLPEHPVLITMDDGYLNNYTHAYPIYQKYHIQATLFVSPFYMKEENTERHFGWLAAQEMENSGLIDIQPHGYDHTPFPYLSSADGKYHASLARGMIEKHLGPRDVSVLAYPQFRHNWRTVRLLNSLDFDFQMINLATDEALLSPKASFSPPKLKRINVPNTMTPDELMATLNQLTI